MAPLSPSEIVQALRQGDLVQAHAAIDAVCAQPALATYEVLDALGQFLGARLRRIYRHWTGHESAGGIPVSPWGGFADPADDEALFGKGLAALARVRPGLADSLPHWKPPSAFSAGGRLTHRTQDVPPYLRGLIRDLGRCRFTGLAAAATELLHDVEHGSA